MYDYLLFTIGSGQMNKRERNGFWVLQRGLWDRNL